jgi:hypothetical protein
MESLALRISDLEESQSKGAAFLLIILFNLAFQRCSAAKKELFELEDKFEAAKFEKEKLIQVPFHVHVADLLPLGIHRDILAIRVHVKFGSSLVIHVPSGESPDGRACGGAAAAAHAAALAAARQVIHASLLPPPHTHTRTHLWCHLHLRCCCQHTDAASPPQVREGRHESDVGLVGEGVVLVLVVLQLIANVTRSRWSLGSTCCDPRAKGLLWG